MAPCRVGVKAMLAPGIGEPAPEQPASSAAVTAIPSNGVLRLVRFSELYVREMLERRRGRRIHDAGYFIVPTSMRNISYWSIISRDVA